MKYEVSVDGQRYLVEIVEANGIARLRVDDQDLTADLRQVQAPSLYSLLMDNHSYELLVEERDDGDYAVFIETELYEVKVQSARVSRLARRRAALKPEQLGETEIKAPMSGLVVAVEVEQGQSVAKGKGLAILEAMKMENEIKAPREGTVKRVVVNAGKTVGKGDLMFTID